MNLQDAIGAKLLAAVEKHEPSGYWSPSQLGFCDRKAVMEHLGKEKNPLDAQTLRNYWMGDRIHRGLQEEMPLEVIGHEMEFEVEVPWRVRGRCDSYVINGDVLEVIEFKSVKGSSWRYGERPHRAHLLQIACYLKWPMHRQGETLLHSRPARGRLVYWNKDDAKMEEYLVTLTPQLDLALVEELDRLDKWYLEYVNDGNLPPPLPQVLKRGTKGVWVNDWRTHWCPYAGRGCCGDEKE